MTQPICFLFDECISRPVVEEQIARSLELFGADATVTHFLAKFPSGEKDQDWIPSLAEEGGWIIVTMDRGRHSSMHTVKDGVTFRLRKKPYKAERPEAQQTFLDS